MRASILTQKRAKALRRNLTRPEQLLWALLRRKAQGFHFRRQHALGPYILDFYCAKAKLCVEVDGPVHDEPEQRAKDECRTAWLKAQEVRVLRFTPEELELRPAVVLAVIVQAAAPSTG